MPNLISRQELQSAIAAERVTVIDALPAAPFAQRHLPGAMNLVAEDPDEHVYASLPDKTVAIATYSTDERCTRGPELAVRLQTLGYTNVRLYQGGIEEWIASGLAVEP